MAANVGNLYSALGMDVSKYKHGLKSSITHTRAWSRDMAKQFTSLLTPMQRYQKELTRLAVMRKGVLDPKTGATLKLSTEQHAQSVANLRKQYSTLLPVVDTFRTKMGKLGASALRSLTPLMWFFGPLGILYGLRRLAIGAEDVERSFTQSLAIMGNVTEEFQGQMKSAARSVAFDTKWSAAQASSAYRFLAQAGLDAQQSLAALPAVAKFAQAGMFDLSRATDLLTDAQIALGLSSKNAQKNLAQMTRVGDVLVKANTLANASVEQFSEALTTKAAGTGKLYSQSIEDIVAVLAVFASAGVKGAAGGEQYSIVMRHLAINAVNNAKAFEKLNITVFNSNGVFRDAKSIFADLDKAMAGMSDRQKVLTLMQLGFTKKTIASTAVLLGMSGAMAKYHAELVAAGGAMQDVSDKMLTDFGEGLNKIKAGLESLAVDAFTESMQSLGSAIEMYADWSRKAAEQQERLARAQKGTAGGAVEGAPPTTYTWGAWAADNAAAVSDIAYTAADLVSVAFGSVLNPSKNSAYTRWAEDRVRTRFGRKHPSEDAWWKQKIEFDKKQAIARQAEVDKHKDTTGSLAAGKAPPGMVARTFLDKKEWGGTGEMRTTYSYAADVVGKTTEELAAHKERLGQIAEAIEDVNDLGEDFAQTWSDKATVRGMNERQKALRDLMITAEKMRDLAAEGDEGGAVRRAEQFEREGRRAINRDHDRWDREKATKEAAKDAEALRKREASRASSLAKGIRDPIQIFTDAIEEAMHLRGMLGEDAFGNLIAKYRDTALKALTPGGGGGFQLPAAHQAGSQGAASAIIRASTFKRSGDKAQKSRDETNLKLDAILRELEAANPDAADRPVEIMAGA